MNPGVMELGAEDYMNLMLMLTSVDRIFTSEEIQAIKAYLDDDFDHEQHGEPLNSARIKLSACHDLINELKLEL